MTQAGHCGAAPTKPRPNPRVGCPAKTFGRPVRPRTGPCVLTFDDVDAGTVNLAQWLRVSFPEWCKAAERHGAVDAAAILDAALTLRPGEAAKKLPSARHHSTQRAHALATCGHMVRCP